MSQPNAAYADLPTADEELFTQAQLDLLFNTVGYDEIAYPPTAPEAALDFSLEQYYTPPESASTTPAPAPAPTPDLFDFDLNFPQLPTDYPTPGSNTPHLYPLEQHCASHPHPALHTHTDPYHPRQHPNSQTTLTAPTPHVQNPIFIRLQTPRARSETPSSSPSSSASTKRRARHTRSSSSQHTTSGANPRPAPTSTPRHIHGQVPTHIGAPMSPDLVFRRVRPEDMRRSRRVIEIGALAAGVRVAAAGEGGVAAALRKVEEVEFFLRSECGECEGALWGCGWIREVLVRRGMGGGGVDGGV